MRENDNGFYIQNNVLIGGIKVAIDIRYIGDDYNNNKWQTYNSVVNLQMNVDES